MRSTLEATLPWWVAGPLLGLVIVSLLGIANKRFGVLGGVTDLVQGSREGRGLRSRRALLLVGIVLGGLTYTLLAGAPDAGGSYSWLDTRVSLAGVKLQPRIVRAVEQATQSSESQMPVVQAAEVL